MKPINIMNKLNESEEVDQDAFAKAWAKAKAEYDDEKPQMRKEIEKEFKRFCKDLRGYFTPDEIRNLPETKAYEDALKDPEDIWCECPEEHSTEFKPDGEQYLGVTKHAYICKKCKKYVQIG